MQDALREHIALHVCCGPCLLEPLDALREEGFEPVIVFANPNIQPREEYELRRDTLFTYAGSRGIRSIEIVAAEGAWEAATAGKQRPARCHACFRLRLDLVSGWAARNGIGLVATTLSVSPYQDPVAICRAGDAAARAAGARFLARDYRERYREAVRRSREAGMYRQNYCGCLPSRTEAEAERAARRRARGAADSPER